MEITEKQLKEAYRTSLVGVNIPNDVKTEMWKEFKLKVQEILASK